MMKSKGAENKVDRRSRQKIEHIGRHISNLRISTGPLLCQFKRGGLQIDRRNFDRDIIYPAPIHDKTWDISKARAQIQQSDHLSTQEPATQKEPNERVAPEKSIQPFEVLEVDFKLLRDVLGTIHHFQDRWIESACRRKKIGRQKRGGLPIVRIQPQIPRIAKISSVPLTLQS
jgi:hypothetical protein